MLDKTLETKASGEPVSGGGVVCSRIQRLGRDARIAAAFRRSSRLVMLNGASTPSAISAVWYGLLNLVPLRGWLRLLQGALAHRGSFSRRRLAVAPACLRTGGLIVCGALEPVGPDDEGTVARDLSPNPTAPPLLPGVAGIAVVRPLAPPEPQVTNRD